MLSLSSIEHMRVPCNVPRFEALNRDKPAKTKVKAGVLFLGESCYTKRVMKKIKINIIMLLLLSIFSIFYFSNYVFRRFFMLCSVPCVPANYLNIFTGQCKQIHYPWEAPWYYIGDDLITWGISIISPDIRCPSIVWDHGDKF